MSWPSLCTSFLPIIESITFVCILFLLSGQANSPPEAAHCGKVSPCGKVCCCQVRTLPPGSKATSVWAGKMQLARRLIVNKDEEGVLIQTQTYTISECNLLFYCCLSHEWVIALPHTICVLYDILFGELRVLDNPTRRVFTIILWYPHNALLSIYSLFPQEVLYAWNAFVLLAKSPPLLRNMLRCTWNELLVIENTKGTWGLV